MTGHDDTSGSLRALAVQLRRLGLRARLGAGLDREGQVVHGRMARPGRASRHEASAGKRARGTSVN